MDLIPKSFFETTESTQEYGRLTGESLESNVLAAYDLRSRYVHTGERFGVWTHTCEHLRLETMLGTPVVNDKKYEKLLEKIPTFIGLERIIRMCLLSFMHRHLCRIDDRLDDGE